MKTFLVGIMLISTNAFAYVPTFDDHFCDFDINGGVLVTQSEIEFLKDEDHLYKIVNNNVLIVDNKKVNLNSAQHVLVSKYSNEIRALMPQVKALATDTLTLASEGVHLAFNELLGPNNNLGNDLIIQLEAISKEIEQSFAINKPLYFDENGFSGSDLFSKSFEKRIENIVEEIIQKSFGSIMVALGQELMFSGNGVDSFDARMNAFTHKLETEMKARSSEIEKRATSLCGAVMKIEQLEEKLKGEVKQLEGINILTI